MPLLVRWPGGERVMEGPFTAGRRADLVVDDEYASPRHAVFEPACDGWTVRDLGSTNGTHVVRGGRMLKALWAPADLEMGDQVRIGRTVLTVVPF